LEKLTKGQITRNAILEKSRQVFNEKGLDITLDVIAQEMGLTKGRITNHFSTKDNLFQAIMGYYEWQLGEYMKHFYSQAEVLSMERIARLVSGQMDIQYENRCAISYLAMITREKRDIHEHIVSSYKRNAQSVKTRLSKMVAEGLMVKQVLQAKTFQVFLFQYFTILTNWVISEQHYGAGSSYSALKPVYLEGAMQCYLPYLTEEGRKQYEKLNFTKLANSA
jgi:AcrR family transcriptional regulator